MSKVENLKEKAKELRRLLEYYAKTDSEVSVVLEKMTGLLDDIDEGRIVPPIRDQFGWYFFNVEEIEPWFIKYPDLTRAEAEYARVLEDWEG